MEKKLDLGFGNSIAVREAFLSISNQKPVILTEKDVLEFNYPAYEGDSELLKTTKEVVERQTGKAYKHVFLTNGATGGVFTSLMVYKEMGKTSCVTRKAPYYLRYPDIIGSTGMIQKDSLGLDSVVLLDYPSNPLGLMNEIETGNSPVILDAVYLNKIYSPKVFNLPKHDILVGSYSKLTGINGLRIGFIACDNDFLAENIYQMILSQYCGMDSAASTLLNRLLKDFCWPMFESLAKKKLDNNRSEWYKLEKFFGTPVSDIGMFHYSELDKKAQELFGKVIIWTKGSSLGTDDSFCRFNLGQSNEVIRDAVKSILRKDSI